MTPSSINLINPLKLSVFICLLTFVFFIVGLISILGLSWQENRIFVDALSQSAIRGQLENIKSGEFREFAEGLSQEFPALSLVVHNRGREVFRFNRSSVLETCKTTHIREHASSETIAVKICKPLAASLSAILPLFTCFFLVVIAIIALAIRAEETSRLSLQNFMREAGLIFKDRMSFGETLLQLRSLQSEFIVLKKKMAYAAEQKTKEKMAAYLAHDLRSPLLVFQEVLRIQDEKELASFKPRLSASIHRVQSMINSLNDNGLKAITRSEVHNFNLQTVLDEAKLHAEDRKIKMISEIEESHTYVLDREKIERAVVNLLHNAIDFCETYVHLRMFSKEDRLVISVLNDGPSVPPEFDELIYKEHFTFGKPRGTGLGLSYAKDVVSAHGGSLEHDRRNGVTVFEIVIPFKSNHTKEERTVLQDKRILVVLSESELRKSLQKRDLPSTWVFESVIPSSSDLKKFSIVYSDIPELISLASKNGLRTVVALSRDSCEKVVLKLTRVLGSL